MDLEPVIKVLSWVGGIFMLTGLVLGLVGSFMAAKPSAGGAAGGPRPTGATTGLEDVFRRFIEFLRSIFRSIRKLYKEAIEETVPHKKIERYGAIFVQVGFYCLIVPMVALVASLIGGAVGNNTPNTPGTTPPVSSTTG